MLRAPSRLRWSAGPESCDRVDARWRNTAPYRWRNRQIVKATLKLGPKLFGSRQGLTVAVGERDEPRFGDHDVRDGIEHLVLTRIIPSGKWEPTDDDVGMWPSSFFQELR